MPDPACVDLAEVPVTRVVVAQGQAGLAPAQRWRGGRDQLADHLASRQRAIQAHQQPRPRLDAIGALEASQPQGTPWRVCGTDSSDGLQRAVLNLAHASGCAAQLQRTALPCDPAMAALSSGERWCLNGGEDFELVLALEPAWAQRLCAALPGCQVIGELVAAASPALSWRESGLPLSDNDPGYRHFS